MITTDPPEMKIGRPALVVIWVTVPVRGHFLSVVKPGKMHYNFVCLAILSLPEGRDTELTLRNWTGVITQK